MACGTLGSLSFLVKGPIILAILFVIDLMTPGGPWVQWAALGIGIAWFFSLLRVLKVLFVLGGLAGLAAILSGRR